MAPPRSADASGQDSGDPYGVLGVAPQASAAEIKAAYRALVKRHHPDAGGDDQRILALNAAWEVLRDPHSRSRYDASQRIATGQSPAPAGGPAAAGSAAAGRPARRSSGQEDALLQTWLERVYGPIERLLGQVLRPFAEQLRHLAADPYDDRLMEAFCAYLEQSQGRLEKVEQLYRSLAAPASAQGFSISLYHCLSQVQDGFRELERYTMGYVDSYLHDGREMLREASRRLSALRQERRRLEL
ncbi:MAG: J domain-containing protein [Synechococcus sp. ELA057]